MAPPKPRACIKPQQPGPGGSEHQPLARTTEEFPHNYLATRCCLILINLSDFSPARLTILLPLTENLHLLTLNLDEGVKLVKLVKGAREISFEHWRIGRWRTGFSATLITLNRSGSKHLDCCVRQHRSDALSSPLKSNQLETSKDQVD